MLDVLNAPNMETYCDYAGRRSIRLRNPMALSEISTTTIFTNPELRAGLDFRTWLIGFEYINGQPYIHSMVYDRVGTVAYPSLRGGRSNDEAIPRYMSEIASSFAITSLRNDGKVYIALLMNLAISFFIFLSDGMWIYIICPAS